MTNLVLERSASFDRIAGRLRQGVVIPACPLALDANRRLDERRQRALVRYYADAGAGGLAVAVHTTQFAIRAPQHGLFRPVVELIAEELDRADGRRDEPMIRIAGVCGRTKEAVAEAHLVRDHGYHAALVSLGALKDATEAELFYHCSVLAEVIPLIGFYLQPAVGGRILPISFWRRLAELKNLIAIKIAPFNRYQTIDVIRALIEVGRYDTALYTGNDDNFIADLVTPYRFQNCEGKAELRIRGGILGQWAVWTKKAVRQLELCHQVVAAEQGIPVELLRLNVEFTDVNAAVFDVANNFAGCIPGIHEVLRRQGLLAGNWCLDPRETLSTGQSAEIDRVCRDYPHLNDDGFIRQNLDRWLNG